jgi:phosphatidylglycerol---prolipoprotein diacylglyceryl transferase
MPVIFAVMASLNYIIWNGSPEIFSVGTFALRWYGLFFALGFLISQQILYYIYAKEGKPEKDVDTLTIYMVIATILGARLGHIIFYDPQIIWESPLSILLPFEFDPFRFTGLQGLASHGGAFGILFALWLYANYSITFSKTDVELKGKEGQAGSVKKKVRRGVFIEKRKKNGQSYFQVVDRIVILVALTGALIRLGNYFNSEIIGKPTDSAFGVVFVNKLTEAIKDRQGEEEIIESIVYHSNDSLPVVGESRVPLSVYVFFKPGVTEDRAHHLMGDARNFAFRLDEFFDPTQELDYEVATQKDGNLAARLHVTGISRHPAQLYESIACVILFVLLFAIWRRYKNDLPAGRLLGIFLIWCFGLRFVFEFLKENQEPFENDLPINMGQILSIPLVIAGILVLAYSYGKRARENN